MHSNEGRLISQALFTTTLFTNRVGTAAAPAVQRVKLGQDSVLFLLLGGAAVYLSDLGQQF
jgi:hypothetical protein